MDICFDLWSRQKPPEVQTKIFYNSFSQKVCIVFILSPDVHIYPSNPGLNFIVIYPTSLTKGTKVEIFFLVLPYTNDSLYRVKFGETLKIFVHLLFHGTFFGSENSESDPILSHSCLCIEPTLHSWYMITWKSFFGMSNRFKSAILILVGRFEFKSAILILNAHLKRLPTATQPGVDSNFKPIYVLWQLCDV